MTEQEKIISNVYRKLGSLCWDCQKAVGRCSWSRRFEEVEGWTAIRRDVQCGRDADDLPLLVKSYFVIDCPEFIQDEVRK